MSGVSSRRALDERYRGFFRLVGDQVATAIANARAYEEEKRRAEKLAALDRAKTTFFSNVSHEFRTPLNLMLGPTEDALAANVPLGLDELRAMHRNELRLLKLVNTLLDFARMEAGRIQTSFRPTDLAALTRDLASTFRSAIERAGLAFGVECTLDHEMFVDRAMWEKVVLNLLSNALKFTFEGEIVLSLRATDEGAELSVSDTGTGIPSDELPHMFERFHRIEGACGRTHEGSGIGLALVSEIASLHGGTVSVESGPDRTPAPQGADVYVDEALRWLPDIDPVADGAPVSTPPVSTRHARVVLADDNVDMRNYVGRLLAKYWRVEAFSNGAEALAAARRERPDLVLST